MGNWHWRNCKAKVLYCLIVCVEQIDYDLSISGSQYLLCSCEIKLRILLITNMLEFVALQTFPLCFTAPLFQTKCLQRIEQTLHCNYYF